MFPTIDVPSLIVTAVVSIATAGSFWFLGGRAISLATIEQYKGLVVAQRERINELESDVKKARTAAYEAAADLGKALARITHLEELLANARVTFDSPKTSKKGRF